MVEIETKLSLVALETVIIPLENIPESVALLPDNFDKTGIAWAELVALEFSRISQNHVSGLIEVSVEMSHSDDS